MDQKFLTTGPMYHRSYDDPDVSTMEDERIPRLPDDSKIILKLLSDPNVASKEWIIRQYGEESEDAVISSLVGDAENPGPGDATVIRPVPESTKGLAAAMAATLVHRTRPV